MTLEKIIYQPNRKTKFNTFKKSKKNISYYNEKVIMRYISSKITISLLLIKTKTEVNKETSHI